MTLKKFIYPLILIVFWSAIFIGTISRPAFLDDADSFHAEVVREMLQSGDWVTFRINDGIRYLEKAPFMYWLAAISATVFGMHDWCIRLPLALFSLFLILLVFRFGVRFWGEKQGLYSGLVMATCLGLYAFTRIFLPDVILSFFMAFCFFMYLKISFDEGEAKKIGPIDPRCAALYASAALAVLTKGMIGIILTGTIIFVHILATGNWKIIKKLQLGYGILIFLIVAAPWHIAAALANPDFAWFYFVREHIMRYLGKRFPKDYDTVPPLFFWALHLVWLFPWSAFAWGLVRNFPKSIRPQEETAKVCLFLFIWIGIILTFYTFGTSQEYYTFPTLAAFALLLGKSMGDLESEGGKWGIVSLGTATVLMIATAGVLAGIAWLGNLSGQANTLSATLTNNPQHYNLSFGHLHDLTPGTFRILAPLVYTAAAYLFVGFSAAFVFACFRRWIVSFFILAAMMIGLAHSYNAGMIAFEPVLSSKNLAKIIEYYYRPGDKVVINDFYEKGSTLNYYAGIQVYVMNGGFGVLWHGLKDPTAPRLAMTEDELLNEWKSSRRIFLFSERKPLDSFLSRHPDLNYHELAETGGKVVLINW